jgi:hypothetical protein
LKLKQEHWYSLEVRAIASLSCSYVDSWNSELLEEEILAYSEKPQKYIDYTEDPTVKMKV